MKNSIKILCWRQATPLWRCGEAGRGESEVVAAARNVAVVVFLTTTTGAMAHEYPQHISSGEIPVLPLPGKRNLVDFRPPLPPFPPFRNKQAVPVAPPEQESLEIPSPSSPSSCGCTNKDASVKRRERRSDRIGRERAHSDSPRRLAQNGWVAELVNRGVVFVCPLVFLPSREGVMATCPFFS
ncbi:hypothetical protein GUJ93_ZPchr0006g42694 [Zizania palustris]|uniref:Uncharacterized protein n=1 Tax=Zizania palustris TaxID=103762 RepID=A0A8J5VVS4_ZIZPA|nr:hypothetical protein GUJ93_ZPchr0006g42694 [Zizania palustris]